MRTLSPEGYAIEAFDEDCSAGTDADLLIIDQPSLKGRRDRIRALRAAASPVALPVLLLAKEGHVSPTLVASELGHTVDDVLRIPSTGHELRARVRNLIRLRALSVEQSAAHGRTRQALAGVSRALRILHACNEVMLWETTESGLINSVCRMITQSEGYALAWVGFAGIDAGERAKIMVHAASGPSAGYVRGLDIRWDDSPKGHGPAGWALASGTTQIISDTAAAECLAPWRTHLDDWGLKAVIAMALEPERGVPGVLVVYSTRAGDFGDEERQLLERLASNLAFGIDRLRIKEEQERQDARIRQLAYSDALTGLPNRRWLLQRLEQVVSAQGEDQTAAVLFIDLNDFKLVNDALGHAAGDEVLRCTAERIQQTLRKDDLVARQGGDEFIVVLVDSPRQPASDGRDGEQRLRQAADALASRIVETLQQPFDIQGYRHRLAPSIGVSLLPYLGADAETVIDQADMAMYEAKQSRRRTETYSPEMGHHRQQRLSLEAQLHQAFEAEEFRLHYQPIWELETGRVVAVEALLRWTNREGQPMSPGDFMPVVEDIGLIEPLGDWVLASAARQLAHWQREGIELCMAVNLSVSQLQGTAASARIRDLITAEGTEPRAWSLELTEDVLMRDPDDVSVAMQALSDAGFRLALDDFGRGYSSLARLQSMPLHALKIDKMFVDCLGNGRQGEGIVSAIVDVGRHLALTVVAEGVETRAQRDRLEAIGCRLGQGFLASPALPPQEIPQLTLDPIAPPGAASVDAGARCGLMDP
ncbi:EAL domain-containing protein [Spiribacter halobius]|nr:EAL domain-containing protein [Spiribacter halobius]UEX77915.1 EAL domain-containing protein [Spiribacter halobius]